MLSKKLKEKNVKDLEYNHLLNKQSIALVLFGTAIISVILTEKLPLDITKVELLVFLFAVGVGILLYVKIADAENHAL
ncbi:MAG: hypothetical protein AABX73_04490 [Nanoarchaeota archaeon]